MKAIIEKLERWVSEGVEVALGSIVERVGSAPRDPGASLAVAASGEVAGGISGGCVEPEVIRLGREVLAGAPGTLRSFGLDDPAGLDAGLSCGGRITVAVYRLDGRLVSAVAEAVRADRPVAVALRLDAPHFGEQTLIEAHGDGDGDCALAAAARGLLELGEGGLVETEAGERAFVEAYAPRPNLYLFGISEHVAALVPIAKMLGYRVTVCDPRRVFLNAERFPLADELVEDWPDRFLARTNLDRRSAICMMSHDLKFDVPGLKAALASEAGFIGAMGSATTRRERADRLAALGVEVSALERIHAPVGLQIGARSPEEVAVSIAAELVEWKMRRRSESFSLLDPGPPGRLPASVTR